MANCREVRFFEYIGFSKMKPRNAIETDGLFHKRVPKDYYDREEICDSSSTSFGPLVCPVEGHFNFWPAAVPRKHETFGGIIKWSVANQNLSN